MRNDSIPLVKVLLNMNADAGCLSDCIKSYKVSADKLALRAAD